MALLVPLVVAWSVAIFVIFVVAAIDPSARGDILVHPALNGSPWYTGLLSNLAVVGWLTASTAGFMGAFVAYVGNRPAAVRMQVAGAFVTMLIGFDQLFQFHRIVIGSESFGGRALMLVLYIALGSAWALFNQAELARTRVAILGAAMSSLLMSATVDLLGGELVTSRALFVDGTNLLAAMAWAVWFVTTATDICRSVVRFGVRPAASVSSSGSAVGESEADEKVLLEPSV